MINEKVQKAINEQINAELYSSYLYLSMASWFESIGYPGFANWMKVQAAEENEHAMKFFGFVIERGGRVLLKAIDAPETEWKSPLACFEAVLEHERKVTSLIDTLYQLARSEKDNASEIFLQWFVTEQVEEEANAEEIVQFLSKVKDAPQGMIMLDRHLAQRKGH